MDLDTTLSLRKPEVQVILDREAASDLGIPVQIVADSLRDPRRRPARHEVPRGRPAIRRLASRRPEDGLDAGTLRPDAPLAHRRPGQAHQPGPPERRARADRDRAANAASGIVTVLGNPEGIPLGEAVNRAEALTSRK